MDKMIGEQLDELARLRQLLSTMQQDYDQRRDGILAQVKSQLYALNEMFEPMLRAMGEQIDLVEKGIREAVLPLRATQRGSVLMAVFRSGAVRVTWDTDKLDGLAVALPELKQFRHESVGQPTVIIKEISR